MVKRAMKPSVPPARATRTVAKATSARAATLAGAASKAKAATSEGISSSKSAPASAPGAAPGAASDSSPDSASETSIAPGGVAAVDRALSLLSAFRSGDRALSLAELSARTGLYKSTALRLLASLAHARWVSRQPDGSYALGHEVARLHGIFAASFSLEAAVLPVLQSLVDLTLESAAFHVRRGDERVCLYRVDSPQLLRDHIRAGDVLPLDRGAGGRVLMAFSGARGKLYQQIRRDRVVVLDGDRVPGLMGISAPVFDANGLLGALTLTVPSSRQKPSFEATVRQAAEALSAQLGGVSPSV
ncbi:IclR family transcriptional regulator [Roseateles amylovorans]|uniref:IclR family transcriptional regulator n=1 Tax=Roseateles amylovorans TaxID=2978473 RepID=A0ABY6AXE2_9BURK|nr:IclR family transcriptional regulator [Roseateles amylovorans]UXH76521.1 IclR family transcriptional regulator [Roseateles amylovorans]